MTPCEMAILRLLEEHEANYQAKGQVQKLTLGNINILLGDRFLLSDIEESFYALMATGEVNVETVNDIEHVWHKPHILC